MICSEITSFMIAAPQLWNSLPVDIRSVPAPSVILNKNLNHFYLVKHFVSTIGLYLYFLTVFLRITLLYPIVIIIIFIIIIIILLLLLLLLLLLCSLVMPKLVV